MMVRKTLKSISLAAVVVGFGFVGVSCSGDEKPAEPVQPAASEEPAAPPPAATDGSSASAVKGETVYFAFDDYTLSSDAQGKLTVLAGKLKANKAAVVQIEGHCDERGSIEYNLALGERRAQSVKNFLVQSGVEAGRLSTISYGEEKSVADGHDESAWSKNRRGEFVVSQQ